MIWTLTALDKTILYQTKQESQETMSGNDGKTPVLNFITYEPGSKPTNKDPTLRSRVRSHVTRLQHRKEREKRKLAGSAGTLPLQLQHPDEPSAELEDASSTVGAVDSETSSLNSPATAGPSRNSSIGTHQSAGHASRNSSISALRSAGTQTAQLPRPSAAQLVRSGKLAGNVSRQTITSDSNDQMARVLANLNLDFATVFVR